MYNAFIENNKITGVAPDTTKDGVLNVEITEEQYNLCEHNGINYFIYSDGNIVVNPNYDQEHYEAMVEECRRNRENAYADEVDCITAHIQRLKDEEQTPEIEQEIADLQAERTAKVEEIKERYPYPEQEQ